MDSKTAYPKILLVEDDEVIASMLKFLLQREKYEVLLAKDGHQALDLIHTSDPPDAIILDNMLPYMSGLQLIPHIRNHARWQQVPILMLTMDGSEQHVIEALNSGADDYIIKPFRAGELMARVRRTLRAAETSSSQIHEATRAGELMARAGQTARATETNSPQIHGST